MKEQLAALAVQRGGDEDKALATLRAIAAFSTIAGLELYGAFEADTRKQFFCVHSKGEAVKLHLGHSRPNPDAA